MAALMHNVRRVQADLETMAELLELQISTGMDANEFLEQRSAAVHEKIAALAGIDTATVLALSRAVNEGHWSQGQKRSLSQALLAAQDAPTPGGRRPKRLNQSCPRFENYPPPSERARLQTVLPHAGVRLIAARAHVVGLTCPDVWTLLRMSAYFHAVRGDRALSDLHGKRDEIQAEIKRLEKERPYPGEHNLQYPENPAELPQAVSEYAGYDVEEHANADDLGLDELLQGQRARAPKDPLKRFLVALPDEMQPLVAQGFVHHQQQQQQGQTVPITFLSKRARRASHPENVLMIMDQGASSMARGHSSEALLSPAQRASTRAAASASPAASPYFDAGTG